MIREYNEQDVDTLVSIWRDATALAHPFLSPEFVEQEADALRNTYLKFAKTWVYEVDSVVVGFIAMIENEVAGLFLRPALHGQGIGRALVDFARARFGALRVEVFEKNRIGRGFYAAYGFTGSERYIHKASGEPVLRLTCAAH